MRAKFLGALSLLVVLAMPAPVSAATQTKTDTLQVRAEVVSAQTIVIDEQSRILEIMSNSTEAVTPRVFLRQVDAANQLPLTPEIYRQYRLLVPEHTLKPGVLYHVTLFPDALGSLKLSLKETSILESRSHLAFVR